jgi:transglutaminase-like putative cysteine protease
MAPGDLSQLLESDALAFRVRFFGDPPAMRDRYWRGPVFDNFDGRRWTASFALESNPAPPINYTGGELSYEITLEPNNQPWLLALELPRALSLPDDAHLNAGAVVITKDPVRERRLYRMTSSIRHQLQQQLDPKQRDRALRLPLNSNPRTVALGRAWQSEGLGTDAIISRALHWFHDEQFVYTLQPPRLEQNPVDQFLFETRRGFCEHYASAFTVLMRAAGIPARIVTGYQGGDRNAVGDYFIVHQSDAHAWSEVWIENQGWVRIDPTAAVAPERIENGISQALRNTADLPSFLNPDRRFSMRYAIEARWDWVNAQWDRWVLGYGPELQHDLFSRFGLDGWRDLMLALTIVMSLLLGVIGVIALRSYRDPILPLDEASRLWNRLRKKMARAGFAQQPGEGATDYARRIAAQRPELATDLLDAARAYQAARYLPDAGADTARSLKNAIDRIRL